MNQPTYILWGGGEAPSLPHNTRVKILLANGMSGIRFAHEVTWKWFDTPNDIVAFYVVSNLVPVPVRTHVDTPKPRVHADTPKPRVHVDTPKPRREKEVDDLRNNPWAALAVTSLRDRSYRGGFGINGMGDSEGEGWAGAEEYALSPDIGDIDIDTLIIRDGERNSVYHKRRIY